MLSNYLKSTFFFWYPDWFDFGKYLETPLLYSKIVIITTWTLGLIFGGIIGPIVEELYFRGYLLPIFEKLKAFSPLVGSILFSLYHFWTPWLIIVRIIGILPMIYFVWWKKNIYIGIYTHCLLNVLADSLIVIPIVFF